MATKNINKAQSNAEKIGNVEVEKQIELLKQHEMIQDKIASSKIAVCYSTHRDQKWMKASWYRECYLRYVTGYNTSVEKTILVNRLKAIAESDYQFIKLFGEPSEKIFGKSYSGCELFLKDSAALIIRTTNTPNSDDADTGCEVPSPLQGINSVNGPPLLDVQLTVKSAFSYDVKKVDNSKDQVWLIHDEDYYHEELGCGIGLLFCNIPTEKPVMED